jgi:hypothetical protein
MTGTGLRPGGRRTTWLTLVVSTVARTILAIAAGLVIWSALPAAWGWIPTTVVSDSMAPVIRAGDVVVAMPLPAEALTPGQVLLVDDPGHASRLRLHRFVELNPDGALILRGDANLQNDSDAIAPEAVHGAGVLRVPWVGLPAVWARNGEVLPLATLVATGILLLGVAMLHRDDPRGRGRRRAGPTIAAAACLVAVAGSVMMPAPQQAHAAFAGVAGNPASALAADAAYPCLAPAVTNSPYLLYRFSEVSGTTVLDSSGNARHGVANGGASRLAGSCVLNSSPALTLDGATSFVSTPNSVTPPSRFSVQVWFRTTTTSGGRLMGFGNSQLGTSTQLDRHLYMTAAGTIVFGVRSGGSNRTIVSPAAYNDGGWHLAVATLTNTGANSGMRLYIDGTLVASNGSITSANSYTGYWKIGYDDLTGWASAPPGSYFAGTIDSVAVYTTARTAAQVLALFAAGH